MLPLVIFRQRIQGEATVSNGCHNILLMPLDINIIATLNSYWVDYRCIIAGITKSEAVNTLKSYDLCEKSESL